MHNSTMGDSSTLKRAANAIDIGLTWIERASIALVCVIMMVVMVLISADAVSRYALNSPLTFTFDAVTMYFLPALLFLPLSMTLRRGGHITVDLFANMLPRRVYFVLIGLAMMASVFVVGIMAKMVVEKAYESWDSGLIVTGLYAWPVWIGEAIVGLSLTILTARLLHVGLSNLIEGIVGTPGMAIPLLHSPGEPLEEAI